MVIYSHSKLSTFEQCPLKFKFKYINKIKPEIEQTIEGFLGNKVHEVLEIIYNETAKGRTFQLDEVIQIYSEKWNKDLNPKIKIVKKENSIEYYFNQGLNFLINYFVEYYPFKDNTIAIEKKISVDLDLEGEYKLQGYIDRLVHHKETNVFEIHDYKTGNFLKTQEELDKDRQLALYSIGVKEMFNQVNEVHLIWHFLAFNKKMVSTRTQSQLDQLKQETIELIKKIEATKQFQKNKGVLCNWCEFQNYCNNFYENPCDTSCNNICDEIIPKKSDWSLYEDEKELDPLIFSNGKSQSDIVNEVINAIEQGYKIIFIKGVCGSGKSAVALNLAKEIGRTSIVVPIKSLQEQYIRDYTEKKYVLKNEKKLKISSIVGRKNFKCRFLEENQIGQEIQKYNKETNATLNDIFTGLKPIKQEKDNSCDNLFLPCKIEIKEKNMPRIKEYIKQNPALRISNFSSINEVKRMSLAPICPYWAPIIPEEFEIKKFKDAKKIKYLGLNNKLFTIYQRRKGCPYYDQYEAYANSDVLIFNSMKYNLETLMDRKPLTELEIIDECDEFLDSFANQEQISLNRLSFALSSLFAEKQESQEILDKLIDITNTLKSKFKHQKSEDFCGLKISTEIFKDLKQKSTEKEEEIFEIKDTLVGALLLAILENKDLMNEIEVDDSNYIYHLDEVARIFHEFFNETFFSIEKRDNDIIINLVTTNLAKKFNELVKKNKILVMMSGTIHSESVLKNIFGLENFKIIEAEIKHQGELIKCKNGYEKNCSYVNFGSNKITREEYLFALSKSISCAKEPILVHVNSFSDLPTEQEKIKFNLNNLPTKYELMQKQKNDPFGQMIKDFKQGKSKILFTTKCNRGIDFPGETCNSIIITKFPYPNISDIFWKILKKTNPQHFMSFYMDKARRELLQKIYRGLRSKTDKVYLLSPDLRVLEF
jgi:putative RecB family exonuclease